MAASIKGSGFESAVADVRRLLAEGRITREELAARLDEEDRRHLEGTIMPSLWYPLSTYDRLIRLLLEKEGAGDPGYLLERGRRAAERLYKAGLYRQLDATLERWGERFGVLMSSLGAAMFSDTRWQVGQVGETHRVEVEVPAEFPECARLTSQGFIEYLGQRASGSPVRVASHRPLPTRVVYEVTRR